jgi:purine-binding chemotaxis protein CheW
MATELTMATDLAHRAAELRRGFDLGFADPPPALDAAPEIDFLACRVGAEPYAIRLAEVGGLHVGKKITRLPGGPPAQLGVAGFRSAVLPVYDLARLLGHAGSATPRWVIVVAHTPMALAFDAFEFHLRAPATALVTEEAGAPARDGTQHRHVHEFVRSRDMVRPVIHLQSIIDAIRGAQSPSGPR